MSHWPIIFSIRVSSISHSEIKGKISKLPIKVEGWHRKEILWFSNSALIIFMSIVLYVYTNMS